MEEDEVENNISENLEKGNGKRDNNGGMLLFCMLVIVIVSRFTTPAPAEQIVGLTFGSTTDEQKAVTRASWNKWDVIHSAIIILITVVFYWYFW